MSDGDNRFIFEEIEHLGDSLGPTYNDRNCVEWHQSMMTGSHSQIAEHGMPEPEDDGADLVAFADFIRATKVPPRGPLTARRDRRRARVRQHRLPPPPRSSPRRPDQHQGRRLRRAAGAGQQGDPPNRRELRAFLNSL